jgi:flagella basal body P-ring formation protein FlgA
MLMMLPAALYATVAMSGQTSDQPVREAIAAAVRGRIGAAASIAVDSLTIEGDVAEQAIQAVPDPGSKLGGIMRFTLRTGSQRTRSASATARVRVSVEHVHAARNLDRGVEMGDGDVIAVMHEISSGALRALPSLQVALHARTVRPIAQDACITAAAIAALPAVRGGNEVVAVARIGDVEATATMTAAESGDAGAVIRVVNRQSKRALKARVVSAGLVEIIHD